jgi:hypothetical protein
MHPWGGSPPTIPRNASLGSPPRAQRRLQVAWSAITRNPCPALTYSAPPRATTLGLALGASCPAFLRSVGEFATVEECYEALDRLEGATLDGMRVHLEPLVRRLRGLPTPGALHSAPHARRPRAFGDKGVGAFPPWASPARPPARPIRTLTKGPAAGLTWRTAPAAGAGAATLPQTERAAASRGSPRVRASMGGAWRAAWAGREKGRHMVGTRAGPARRHARASHRRLPLTPQAAPSCPPLLLAHPNPGPSFQHALPRLTNCHPAPTSTPTPAPHLALCAPDPGARPRTQPTPTPRPTPS